MKYTGMNTESHSDNISWFAIKSRRDFAVAQALSEVCDEVFFPTQTVKSPSGAPRTRAVIPHVVFVRAPRRQLLELEIAARKAPGSVPSFWIYRYPDSAEIQPISPRSIDLLRLLTSDDTSGCRIYSPREFKPSDRVRIIDGLYKGYEGFVKRVAKNKHVVVSIEGLCMVILPFIHPDLLERVEIQ